MTVFWTMCTPNHIAIRAIQIMHHDVIWRRHGPNYRVSNFNSKFELKLKLRTLLSCENSQCFACLHLGGLRRTSYQHLKSVKLL